MKALLCIAVVIASAVAFAQVFPQLELAERQYSTFVVDSISIQAMPLKDAVEELRRKASEASAGRITLNVVFPQGIPDRIVSLTLSRVPLHQVIRYFGDVTGLRARFEPAAIVFTAAPARNVMAPQTAGVGTAPGREVATLPAESPAAAKIPIPNAVESPSKPRFKASSIPPNSVYRYISAVTLGWRNEPTVTKKVESQRQVLFRDASGRFTDQFFKIMEELNAVFGYQKLVPQLSTKEETKEQAITVFLGARKDAKKFLFDSSRQTRKFEGAWDGWFWWDGTKEMSKGAIAICIEEIDEHSFRYYLLKSILVALGYPGHTDRMGSIFDGYSKPDPGKKQDAGTTEFLTEGDRVILRFCDRFLATDASRTEMRRIISKEWPQFAAEWDKAAQAPAIAK